MCQVNGSHPVAPPSLARVPVSPVPCGQRYYEGATTSRLRIPGRLSVWLPGSARSSTLRARLGGAPGWFEDPSGPGHLLSRRPFAGTLSPGRNRDLTGSQATRPMPLPRSKTPAGPTILTKSLPVVQQHRLRRIGGLRALNFIHGGLRSLVGAKHDPVSSRRQQSDRPPAAGIGRDETFHAMGSAGETGQRRREIFLFQGSHAARKHA